MILDNSGKIGILNTTPSYPLDVAGDINMSTGSSFRINGVAQTFGGGGGGSSLWTAGTGSYSTTINRDSNVGISNTAPDHKLSVAGDIFSSSSSGFIGYGGNLSGISIQGERNNTIINFGIGSNTQSAYANPD
jgi:ethanolamine utilization microcompartment shell protein EutS